MMANKPSVHVEPRENGWAVVREGSERATSVHRTQSEAAKEGRNIARGEETEFFLHAQDGRVREHRSYGEGAPAAEQAAADQTSGHLDAVSEAVGQVTTGVSAAVGALGGAAKGAGESPSRGAGPSGRATQDVGGGATSTEESGDKAEARDLAHDQHDRWLEGRYTGYEIYDESGERIGKLEDLFVDEDDSPEYVGVRVGSSGTGFALIPADVVTVDDRLRRMVVSRPKSVVEASPTYGAHEEVTPALEDRVRSHYGLAGGRGAGEKGAYGTYHRDEERAERGVTVPEAVGPTSGSAVSGKVRGGDREASLGSDRDRDDDEFRVRRIEEELKVGTRKREVGAVRVRKRVITDHETIVVPKKRVEVTVEHVPVEEGAIPAEEGISVPETGEDEIVVPVVEEEVVVEKRPVVKEEVRIRKEVVEESEVVEEDVRREEIEVDDQTPQNDL